MSEYSPFKMKGSPMQRNFGIGSPAKDAPEGTHPEHHNQEKQDIIDIKKRIRQGELDIGTKDVSGITGKKAIRKELLKLKLTRESDAEKLRKEKVVATYTPSFKEEEVTEDEE